MRVARIECAEPEAGGELSHHAVGGVRVHRATILLAFSVGTQRLEQRAVEVGAALRRPRSDPYSVNESNPAADHEGIGSRRVNFRRHAEWRTGFLISLFSVIDIHLIRER